MLGNQIVFVSVFNQFLSQVRECYGQEKMFQSLHEIRLKSIEIGVLEGRSGRDAFTRLQMDHLLQQIYCLIVEVYAPITNVLIGVRLPLGEGYLHLGKICKTLPGLLGRGAHCPENFKDLTDLRIASKEGLFVS